MNGCLKCVPSPPPRHLHSEVRDNTSEDEDYPVKGYVVVSEYVCPDCGSWWTLTRTFDSWQAAEKARCLIEAKSAV